MPGKHAVAGDTFPPATRPAAETWTGQVYSRRGARVVGVREIWDKQEFEPFWRALRARKAYRPQAEACYDSTVTATAEPVTPPVPMAEVTTAAAAGAATPAQPVTGRSSPKS